MVLATLEILFGKQIFAVDTPPVNKNLYLGIIQIGRGAFISPTSPKNDGIAFGFKRFPLLDGFSAHSEILYFLDHF